MTVEDERKWEIDGHEIIVRKQKKQIDIKDTDGNLIVIHKRNGVFGLVLKGNFEFRGKPSDWTRKK